jgi:hypothetical protein
MDEKAVVDGVLSKDTMNTQKYSVNQHLIETILSWVKSKEIALPEIQRPFVWDATRVRDLIDSLYKGYPIGYLIAWRNPNIRLKDGKTSEGKKILIDGQQRVSALTAAILGHQIVNKYYQKVKIQIAFNPLEERFEVFNTAIAKDNAWIKDISPIITGEERVSKIVRDYRKSNPKVDEERLEDLLENLKQIIKKQVGLIELDSDLDIETVTEIFIRINSQGVVLSQADFAMSKIAANETFGGSVLRKCVDYFCHLSIAPEYYSIIKEADKEFAKTDYFRRMTWLKDENDDLYDPSYTDLLRVAFTSEFQRGRLADLVSLLSGRNFETRTYEEQIAKESFAKLEKGILNFINETNFKRFVMIVKSAGFISPELIRSLNALDFAYILYIVLKSFNYNAADIESYVRRWFVLSVLTGRYSGSPESQFDSDIRGISNKDFAKYINTVELGELSDAFWDVSLVESLDTSSTNSPYFSVFLAAQVKANDKGFLSKDISVNELISHRGDVHHVFPKDYLKKCGLKKAQYNQIANFVYMQSEINVKIGNKAPSEYLEELKKQCDGGKLRYGGIDEMKTLDANLEMNCIPKSAFGMDVEEYEKFLKQRRMLMAKKIKKYYASL